MGCGGIVEASILRLMAAPKGESRNFKFGPLTAKRLEKLGRKLDKSDTAILEIAITHLLSTLERDEPVRMTIPTEGSVTHKRGVPPDAA
jgi:hypothetical protein